MANNRRGVRFTIGQGMLVVAALAVAFATIPMPFAIGLCGVLTTVSPHWAGYDRRSRPRSPTPSDAAFASSVCSAVCSEGRSLENGCPTSVDRTRRDRFRRSPCGRNVRRLQRRLDRRNSRWIYGQTAIEPAGTDCQSPRLESRPNPRRLSGAASVAAGPKGWGSSCRVEARRIQCGSGASNPPVNDRSVAAL